MLFSSITFLYYFLPCTLILYFIVPKVLKNTVILAASLVFYGWGEPKYLILMLAAILQGYVFGILIEKFRKKHKSALPKLFLSLSVIVSLGMLGFCKYADFFIDNFNAVTGFSVPLLKIALPIGISFYTFQILSYTVDVYRMEVRAQRNIINLAAYVTMFPQLIAGPIVRYSDIAAQLEERRHTLEDSSEGVRRFVLGLSKKVMIANVLGELVAEFKASDEKSVIFAWTYAIAYALHIYFDFSGYSDMAIGLGKLFGFHFTENFNYPYISRSITEFWRRWHMSLGSWFRDYLYIPLGGNRCSKLKWLRNILIVWAATGFWHGAEWNFILWGLMFAVLLMVEKLWLMKRLSKSKVLSHIYVMFFILISFVIFDMVELSEAFTVIRSMFGFGKLPAVNFESLYYLRSYAAVLIIAAIGATPLPKKIIARIRTRKAGECTVNIAEPLYLTVLLAVCTAFLIDGSFNPFLYFRF